MTYVRKDHTGEFPMPIQPKKDSVWKRIKKFLALFKYEE